MKINKTLITILLIALMSPCAFAENAVWVKQSPGILGETVNCLYISPNNSFILAGTSKALYRTDVKDGVFFRVFELQGSVKGINQIYVNPLRPTSLYIATDAGVFVSLDQGQNWYSTYTKANPLENKSLAVIADENEIAIGTTQGLFMRNSGGQDWKKVSGGELGQKTIYRLQQDEQYIYASTDADVYRITKGDKDIKKIYSAGSKQSEDGSVTEDGESLPAVQVKDLEISPNGRKLYVVAGENILTSRDQGENWRNIAVTGLPVKSVKKLYVNSLEGEVDKLYAATEKGVFSYSQGLWYPDIAGLATNQINDLTQSRAGTFYAATSEGVFVKIRGREFRKHNIAEQFSAEPSIAEVHRMAINYANVNPDQIKLWHKESRAKALLPTFSVGLNRSATELFHWDSGSNPDTLLHGRDYLDWSTSLSWNFSDLVWSSDHTTIDSRSKLMSELRTDILDQITRLYFERRRVQVELTTRDLDENAYMDKQMRLEELTALIDGFTGGEFSRHIQKNVLVKSH